MGRPLIHYTHLTFSFPLTILILCLFIGSKHAKEFLSEAHILKYLRNPNIIQLYAVSTEEEPFFIVTELMSHSCLLDYLRGTILHVY